MMLGFLNFELDSHDFKFGSLAFELVGEHNEEEEEEDPQLDLLPSPSQQGTKKTKKKARRHIR